MTATVWKQFVSTKVHVLGPPTVEALGRGDSVRGLMEGDEAKPHSSRLSSETESGCFFLTQYFSGSLSLLTIADIPGLQQFQFFKSEGIFNSNFKYLKPF